MEAQDEDCISALLTHYYHEYINDDWEELDIPTAAEVMDGEVIPPVCYVNVQGAGPAWSQIASQEDDNEGV